MILNTTHHITTTTVSRWYLKHVRFLAYRKTDITEKDIYVNSSTEVYGEMSRYARIRIEIKKLEFPPVHILYVEIWMRIKRRR